MTLPEDFPIESIRDMEAVFAVTVTGLKSETLPDLDDDFANQVEAGKTLDEITDLIKEDLEMRMKRQLEEIKINSVLAKLGEAVDFDFTRRIPSVGNPGTSRRHGARRHGARYE